MKNFEPTVHAIVQARLGSKRFPNKMLADLCGKPVIRWVVDRLSQCKRIQAVVIATPDKELANMAADMGAWGFEDTGDPNNVLARYIKAANWSGAEIVVRICGDCPLIDPALVDRLVEEYVNSRVDLVTNVQRRSFPKGMDVEVMHKNTLKRIHHLTENPLYREHVTLFVYENPALFVVKNISNDGMDYSYLNLSIDSPADLARCRNVVLSLGGGFGVKEVIEYLTGEVSVESKGIYETEDQSKSDKQIL